MSDLNYERDVMPVAAEMAAAMFSRQPNRAELIADVMSTAWEFTLSAPDEATPKCIVWYAIKRVRSNRQFYESSRCLMGPNPRRVAKHARECLTIQMTATGRGDPARIVEYRLDFRDWINQLRERSRGIALMLALGYTTTEVAEAYGVTLGAISQYRERLLRNWKRFRGQ